MRGEIQYRKCGKNKRMDDIHPKLEEKNILLTSHTHFFFQSLPHFVKHFCEQLTQSALFFH